MRLEIGTFPVERVGFGTATRWADGTLEIAPEELEAVALEDPNISRVRIELAAPGESVRVINMRDRVEPRAKVDGPGVVYPAVFGRSVDRVGEGRTHRLGGVAVLQCAEPSGLTAEEQTWPPLRTSRAFFDMTGPGSFVPAAGVNNICLVMETRDGVSGEDWYAALGAATLRVSDRLADITRDLDPPEIEAFDDGPAEGLPGVVSVFNLASDEWFCGARSVLGTSVYGQTRLSAPWLLSATELMDGAVYEPGPELMTANPVAMRMARRHGVECNYLGAIIQRTNWTTQAEKEMAAARLAHLAASLGAEGAVLTTDIRGQRFVEAILGLRACEQAGIKTVLLTPEEDDEEGTAPPLLISAPEVVSVVSTGTGGQEETFPAVDRVVGAFDPDPEWRGEQPSIHGQYGQMYFNDIHGRTRQGCVDY
jgi:glycine reductase